MYMYMTVYTTLYKIALSVCGAHFLFDLSFNFHYFALFMYHGVSGKNKQESIITRITIIWIVEGLKFGFGLMQPTGCAL